MTRIMPNVLETPRLIRANVLGVSQRLSAWVACPLLALFLVRAKLAGQDVRWLALETLCFFATAFGPSLAASRSIRVRRRILVASYGFATIFGALHYGPNFGIGIFYTAWVLGFIFFERHWQLATILGGLGVAAVGVATQYGFVATTWTATGPDARDWIRMTLSAVLVTSALGFMFDRVLGELENSLRAEIAAREAAAEAHAAREAALAALASSQRVESLGRLAGGVAHDFNNALGILSLGLDALRDDPSAGDRDETLSDMTRAVRGAQGTTQQLLSFVRQGSTPSGRAEPATVLAGMAQSLARLLPETITIVSEFEPVPPVAMPVGELEQALLNLCLNARDAMLGEGTLTLRTRTTHVSGERMVIIEVVDTGEGMSDDVRVRALDPFFTTKADAKGTGLGLSMVQFAVTGAGGSVEIDSAIAHGTTIRLRLPVAAEREPPSPIASAPSHVGEAHAIRILVVEDEPDLMRITSRLLAREGYEIDGAISVSAALERLSIGRLPDLLLTDARLADGSSAPVIREYRRLSPSGPVLLCSGHVPDEGLVGGIEADTFEFLQKPYGRQTLLDTVAKALAD